MATTCVACTANPSKVWCDYRSLCLSRTDAAGQNCWSGTKNDLVPAFTDVCSSTESAFADCSSDTELVGTGLVRLSSSVKPYKANLTCEYVLTSANVTANRAGSPLNVVIEPRALGAGDRLTLLDGSARRVREALYPPSSGYPRGPFTVKVSVCSLRLMLS